ncbi:MAG: CvpA family protein [Oscillospiraceae bacterium]|nr:CvpA family protein [Oscillospiraceae bacterium]
MDHAVDAAVAAIFCICALVKGCRGLYRSLMSLLVFLAAMLGAYLLSRSLADTVTALVYPWVQAHISPAAPEAAALQTTDAAVMTGLVEQSFPDALLRFMRNLGMETQDFIARAMGSPTTTAQEIVESAAAEMLLQATRTLVRAGLFLLSFLLLLFLLTLLKNALGLTTRLPVIHFADRLGGAAFGIAECALALYALLWLANLLQIEGLLHLAAQSRILARLASAAL